MKMTDMKITDKAVLVTGANRGTGLALVEEALRRGAKRVYAGTRVPLAHSDGRVTALTLDVTNAAQIQEAIEEVVSVEEEVDASHERRVGVVDVLSVAQEHAQPLPLALSGT